MGAPFVALWLAAALSADPPPIGGAFGVTFSRPVDRVLLGPVPTRLPLPALLAGFESVDPPAHMVPTWHWLTPLLPLEVLAEVDPRYLVQTGTAGEPLRIRVEAEASDGCSRLQHELAGLLAVKYASQSATPWVDGTAEYGAGDRRASLSCIEPRLVLEYVDNAAYAAWYDRWTAAIAEWRAAEALRKDRALADRVTLGDRDALEGAFGIGLRTEYPAASFALPDIPLPVPAVDDAGLPVSLVSIVLDPERVPYEVRAELTFENERLSLASLDELRRVFRERYGPAARDQSNHLIFNIGGDLLAFRLADPTRITLTAVRQSGLQDQRLRKRESLAHSETERKVGWDSTLRGLPWTRRASSSLSATRD